MVVVVVVVVRPGGQVILIRVRSGAEGMKQGNQRWEACDYLNGAVVILRHA